MENNIRQLVNVVITLNSMTPIAKPCSRQLDIVTAFPIDSLQNDFQLIRGLRLRLECMVLFQRCAPDVMFSRFNSEEIRSHSVFSMNPFAFSEFSTTLEH